MMSLEGSIKLYEGNEKKYAFFVINYLYKNNTFKMTESQICNYILTRMNISELNYDVIHKIEEREVIIDEEEYTLYTNIMVFKNTDENSPRLNDEIPQTLKNEESIQNAFKNTKENISLLTKKYMSTNYKLSMPKINSNGPEQFPIFMYIKLNVFYPQTREILFLLDDTPSDLFYDWYNNWSQTLRTKDMRGVSIYINSTKIKTLYDYETGMRRGGSCADIQVTIIAGFNMKDAINYGKDENINILSIKPFNCGNIFLLWYLFARPAVLILILTFLDFNDFSVKSATNS